MSVNTELSALLTKMGGTPLESDSNSDLIKKISAAYEGGGGSGSGILVVHEIDTGEVDVDDHPIYQLDKTWKEIHDVTVLAVVVKKDESGAVWKIVEIAEPPSDPSIGTYKIYFMASHVCYSTDSENGYPTGSSEAAPR